MADRRWSARRCGVALAVLLGVTSPSGARATTDRYDLAACIDTALRDNPDLAAAAAQVALARAQLDDASARRFGQIEYNQQVGAVNGATGDILQPPKQNRNAILQDLGPFVRLDVGLNLPIYTFGKLSSALAAAEAGLRGQEAGGAAKRAEVILSVKQLYYGLLLARSLAVVLHDMLDDMDKAVKKTQERLDAGSTTVTEIDLLKLQAGRAKFASGVVEIDTSTKLTERALRRAMALPDDAPFDIADRKLQPVAVPLAPLDAYHSGGVERRPEMRQLEAGVAAQSAQVERQEAGWYPNLFFAGGFRYAYAPNRTEQSNPFAYDNFNYTFPYVFLGVQWDLSLLQTAAKIDEARATLDSLRATKRNAESGLALEIRQAYADVEKTREVMRTTEAGRKAGRGLLVLTVANFDLGIGEAEELFKGVGTYTETSADHLHAVHDFNVAVATLSKAVGEELAPLRYAGAEAAAP